MRTIPGNSEGRRKRVAGVSAPPLFLFSSLEKRKKEQSKNKGKRKINENTLGIVLCGFRESISECVKEMFVSICFLYCLRPRGTSLTRTILHDYSSLQNSVQKPLIHNEGSGCTMHERKTCEKQLDRFNALLQPTAGAMYQWLNDQAIKIEMNKKWTKIQKQRRSYVGKMLAMRF